MAVNSKKVFLIAGLRTTISPAGGFLRNTPIEDMTATVLSDILEQLDVETSEVDAVLISNAIGGGGNIARLCTLKAGFSSTLLGTSIDRQCVGGLDAIIQATNQIQRGEANLILAGGVESFSLRPERYYPLKWKNKPTPLERPPFYPTDDPTIPLGETIKTLKESYNISDEEEFEWVQNSHRKALAYKAQTAAEIVSLTPNDQIDPFAREITKKVYQKANATYGHTHPCNTAPKADGAAFVAVASEEMVKKINPVYCIEIKDGFTLGGTPKSFPILPAKAMKLILEQNNLKWKDINQIALMEAYAVQAILCAKLSGAPVEKINSYGGAIAYGHPIGASGAVLAVRLFHTLKSTQKTGIAAIAGAGGLASVLLLKNK